MKMHIELDRRFYRIDEDADAFPEDTSMFGDSEYITEGWDKLLARKRVVVLAEAGMGKSEELRTRAQDLAAAGRPAFYARIERLADVDFVTALEQGDAAKLDVWRAGEGVAYVFLDSVDEARLTHKRFTDSLKAVARAIEGAEERAHIFVSSRPSDWRWAADIATLKELLPVRTAASTPEEEEPPPLSDEALLAPIRERNRREPEENEQSKKKETISVVRLLGLTRAKIEKFARERDVTDVPAFMQALTDADALTLVARPQDLDGIITIWDEKGRIGTHVQALRENITRRSRETNLDQAELRELSDELTLHGARRIAAGLALGGAATVAIPGGEQEREGALDVDAILPKWAPKQHKALLSRAIFDPATFGRVRFHHLEVQELLTADWLLERMEKGCPQEKIEDLLIAESHGFTVIRPSLRAVAAWVGQHHAGVRRRLLAVAPEVLIEGGDPSLLPVSDRVRLLQHFADRYRGRKDSGTSINIDNVKRLAHADLAPTIQELWNAHPDSDDVRELLLRLIWSGAIQSNASIAVAALQSPTSSDYLRSLAMRALSTAGSNEQRRAAVDSTIERADELGRRIVGEAIDAFYPNDMTDEQLTALIQTSDKREARSGTGLGSTIDRVASRVPIPVVERLLHLVMSFIRAEPHTSEHVAVSRRYESLLDPLSTICERLLAEADIAPGNELSEAVELLSKYAFWQGNVHVDTKELSLLVQKPHLTRHFFWRSFTRAVEDLEGAAFQGAWQLHQTQSLWHLKESDLAWLMEDLNSQPSPDARVAALTAALSIWNSSGRSDSCLGMIREVIGGDEQLNHILHDYLNPSPRPLSEHEQAYRRRREERQRETDEDRRRIYQSWLTFRDDLRENPGRLSDKEAVTSHSNFGDLRDITTWIQQKAGRSHYSVGDWELLEGAFGQAVAEAARDGLSAFWKTIDCADQLQSDQANNGVIVALVGVGIDARKPCWAASLTEEEARRATKIAFKEINGFPLWFNEILQHQKSAAVQVLQPLISSELQLEQEAPDRTRVVERISYASTQIQEHIAPLVVDLLEQQSVRRPQTLRRALHVTLLFRALDRGRFSRVAEERIAAHQSQTVLEQLWLAALLCVDADAGVKVLQRLTEGMTHTEADGFVLGLLNTLYEHRDLAFGNTHADFLRSGPLVPFLTLVLAHIRPQQDNKHEEGSYTPDARDAAEQVRSNLLERFTSIPGRATIDTLLSLRDKPEWAHYRERLLVWAERRAALDGDLKPWKAADVAEFEERLERPVRSSQDLYEIASDRLATLKHDLEHGDYSSRDLLRQDQLARALEGPVQNWFARELNNTARHRYTVHREGEVIDGNEPDIRVASEGADGPTSVEIKVADSWEFDQLEEALEDQLVGKYMRAQESRFGVLLLTWHGKRATWIAGDEELKFARVTQRLCESALVIRNRNPHIDGLSVIGIDLSRDMKSKQGRKKRTRDSRKRA